MRETGAAKVRTNVGYDPDVYEYLKIMSAVAGTNATEYVNALVRKDMEENQAKYRHAKRVRDQAKDTR